MACPHIRRRDAASKFRHPFPLHAADPIQLQAGEGKEDTRARRKGSAPAPRSVGENEGRNLKAKGDVVRAGGHRCDYRTFPNAAVSIYHVQTRPSCLLLGCSEMRAVRGDCMLIPLSARDATFDLF